ncbi:TQO small subunit DoxD [Glycomyces xiaoerkulensis]|uniref:TQO small subunit DoxD n=1 Tax=Glycomyces xiaoerkulensis TaxID=2038139 RepID=UPI000C267A2B|nr:TQO small subunit DoxD [Glycomyces xiaoerkulensis]
MKAEQLSPAAAAPNGPNARLIALARVGVALMWIDNASWKVPPDFGRGDPPRTLYRWTLNGIEYEVFAPWARFLETVVVPNFAVFGWLVLALEASLGAFLLIGLFTRLFALLGIVQSLAIALSALGAPHEWYWAYLLMMLVHLLLFTTAAGRFGGMDGLLRPLWKRRSLAHRLMRAAS